MLLAVCYFKNCHEIGTAGLVVLFEEGTFRSPAVSCLHVSRINFESCTRYSSAFMISLW